MIQNSHVAEQNKKISNSRLKQLFQQWLPEEIQKILKEKEILKNYN